MKKLFSICAVLFVAMYAVAQATMVHPKEDGKVHLKWATDPNPARVVQTSAFGTMFPDTAVAVDPNASGDSTKVIVQCATGTGADLMDVTADKMQSLVEAGILLDLTPYAKTLGFDPSHTYPSLQKALLVEGKQYAFPCNVAVDAIVFNKKIFDDHGVAYPKPDWTYDDFVRVSKELQDKPSKAGNTDIPFANNDGNGFVNNAIVGCGGQYFTADGLHSTLNSPEVIKAVQLYADMMYKDKVIPTPMDSANMSAQGGWGSGGLTIFSGGKAAMVETGRWYICQLPNFPEMQGHIGAVPLPRVGDRPSGGTCGARGAGVNAKSPHWRESLKFLQYLASPQYSKIIVDDGDSLPPDPNLASSGKALVNDIVPDPEFHQAFVTAINNAKPIQYSPFIDAAITSRWYTEYVQKVENRILTPPQAMKMLAAQIDQQIRTNLERRPDLQKKYEQVTGKQYTPDWS
jgi:multiple sugar transport system substrate-binding protein